MPVILSPILALSAIPHLMRDPVFMPFSGLPDQVSNDKIGHYLSLSIIFKR